MKKILLGLLLVSGYAYSIAPSNDNCANATTLTPNSSCTLTNGTVQDATSSSTSSCSSTVNSDVFYKFTAVGSSATITVTPSGGFDPVVEVISSCGGSNIICRDLEFDGGTEIISNLSVTSGQTYYIRISDYNSSLPSTYTFTICVQSNVISNEDCANAINVVPSNGSCSSPVIGTLGNTQSMAGCIGNANDDVWYKFTATGTQTMIEANGAFDEVIQVFSNCSTSIDCTDNNYLILNTVIGTEYKVRVYDYFSDAMNGETFDLCIYTIQPPSNDNCANAISVTPGSGSCSSSTSANNIGATESQAGCQGNADDDTWYKFIANGTIMVIEADANSSSTIIEAFSSCGGSSIKCGINQIQLTNVTIGNTYYYRVYDYYQGYTGNNTLSTCVYSVSSPSNNACANAIAITPSNTDNSVNGTLLGATGDGYTACVTNNADDDVWYKFTATNSAFGYYFSSNFNPVVEFYTSCGGTSLSCISGNSGNITSLVSGTTYYIRIYSTGTDAQETFTFHYFFPAANDNCENAQTLVVNGSSANGDVSNGTAYVGISDCNGTANDDVWYKYIPSVATGDSIEVTGSSSFDAVIQLATGCNGTELGCVDQTNSGGLERIITSGLTPGNTYYIRVYDYYNSRPSTSTFTVLIRNASIISSLENTEWKNSISLYPNPAQTEVKLTGLDAPTSISIFTMEGKKVLETSNQDLVDINSLPNGLYMVKLQQENKVAFKNLVIQK